MNDNRKKSFEKENLDRIFDEQEAKYLKKIEEAKKEAEDAKKEALKVKRQFFEAIKSLAVLGFPIDMVAKTFSLEEKEIKRILAEEFKFPFTF